MSTNSGGLNWNWLAKNRREVPLESGSQTFFLGSSESTPKGARGAQDQVCVRIAGKTSVRASGANSEEVTLQVSSAGQSPQELAVL